MSVYSARRDEFLRWADELRWKAGSLRLDRTRPMGWSLNRGHGCYANSEESWVVSASVDALLALGFKPEWMFVEFTIEGGSRPDLLVVEPERVSIFEAKRGMPNDGNRRQVRRYIAAAGRRWPDREIRAFLVWPASRDLPWPYAEQDLRLEDVA